jgi:acyl-CoA thioesterase-1
MTRIKNKKIIGAILIAMVVFLAYSIVYLSGCTRIDTANIDSKGVNIVCIGDSMTYGYGATPGEDDYPAHLSRMMSIPVINVGVDGDTSNDGVKRLKVDVLDRQPLLVIIEFGGNDFLRKIPFADTVKNVEYIISKSKEAGAMVAIMDMSVGMIMENYGKEYRRLAKKHNVILIPHILSDILTNASLKSDFVHPNGEGYKVLAQKVYRYIIPYLNQNNILRRFGKPSLKQE